MSVKASVSITERQDAFVRQLVQHGRYPSVSAVVQRGLELLKAETERQEAEVAALRHFFEERAAGPFVRAAEGRERTEAMIARKRAQHGR
ncbi:MAG: type II toxin-antitoxin system ParD family antitoxin [Pseudomonadota bacterium]